MRWTDGVCHLGNAAPDRLLLVPSHRFAYGSRSRSVLTRMTNSLDCFFSFFLSPALLIAVLYSSTPLALSPAFASVTLSAHSLHQFFAKVCLGNLKSLGWDG